jgi:hypothetical protein
MRTGASPASAYGWDELAAGNRSNLAARRLPLGRSVLYAAAAAQGVDLDGAIEAAQSTKDPVRLRVVDEPWPFRRTLRLRSRWPRSTTPTMAAGASAATSQSSHVLVGPRRRPSARDADHGLSQISMLKRYQHVQPAMLADAAERLQAVFPAST